MGGWGERRRRGSGEEGIPVWVGRQPKKESANNIASLVAVGKAKEKKESYMTQHGCGQLAFSKGSATL